MKKLTAFLLALVLVFSAASSSGFAWNAKKITDYPVIIVPGYSSTSLYYGDSLETGEKVWGINMELIAQRILANIAELGIGLGATALGNGEYIAKIIGEEFDAMFEKLRCNPDGSSVYELHRDYTDAADLSNVALMERFPDGRYRQEREISDKIAEYIGHAKIYNFSSDFRMGSEICAGQLNAFIQSVKRESGKKKVNIFALSHGGQVTATYLNLYGKNRDVDNAVLTVPAIGGAQIAYDVGMSEVKLDEDCLLRFMQHGNCSEEDYDWLVKANRLGFLNNAFNELAPYIVKIMGYWGSVWDFIPMEYYEEAKAALLDPVKNAELIKKSDRFHYKILPSMGKKLAECIKSGMNISIIAGSGNPVVTGARKNSDGIISTDCATGAVCAPWGKRFPDGYKQKKPLGGKNKISPAMDVDASTAYMPDNTWIVNGLYHGMTIKDDYTAELLKTLLLTDELTDVYSDPKFPQFRDTSNPSSAVYASFEGCGPGFLTGKAKNLEIENVCKKSRATISAVYCDGLDLKFKLPATGRILKPGEKLSVPVKGEIPKQSGRAFTVTVCYSTNTVTPAGYRTQTYTLDNGKKVKSSGELASAEPTFPIDKTETAVCDAILRRLGLKEYAAMVTTTAYYRLDALFGFMK